MSDRVQTTILLVEPDTALRRLLALGLQHQGMRVIETSALDTFSARQLLQADLLLLDMDTSAASDCSLFEAVHEHPSLGALPIVALAWETPVMTPGEEQAGGDRYNETGGNRYNETGGDRYNETGGDKPPPLLYSGRVAYVAKPFDARSLYATIDDLLAASLPREAAQPQLAALSAPAPSSMSIWPLITAVGLLIIIVGFMLQIAISAAGLLIVLIALLWWTLGTGKNAPKENRLPAGCV